MTTILGLMNRKHNTDLHQETNRDEKHSRRRKGNKPMMDTRSRDAEYLQREGPKLGIKIGATK